MSKDAVYLACYVVDRHRSVTMSSPATPLPLHAPGKFLDQSVKVSAVDPHQPGLVIEQFENFDPID